MKNKPQLIASTAVDWVHKMSESGFPFAKEMYEALVEVHNPEHDTGKPKADYSVRSELILKEIEKSGISQVLEFGSGWSTHGLHLCKSNPDFRYVEVLLKDENTGFDESVQKREVLDVLWGKVGGKPENYHTIGGNAADEKSFEEAAEKFDPAKPVMIANMGLMVYLNMDEKLKYGNNVKSFLQEFGGKWLTDDLSPGHNKYSSCQDIKDVSFAFESDEEIKTYLDKVGLDPNFLVDSEINKKVALSPLSSGRKYQHSSIDVKKTT
jgi:hypothetical protein